MGKHSKVSSSTELRLGENVVTSARLQTHFGVHNIRATGVLNNANALSLGTNSCKKWNMATLNSAHQAKKQCNFDSG